MKDKVFVDTNILVYAHDLDAGSKHDRAAEIVTQLWQSRNGVLSAQVLQEFYVTLTRKVSSPLSRLEARKLVQKYSHWQVVPDDPPLITQASEIEESYSISFWDALIVSAAYSQNVTTILTEDLNHGQIIEGILIENPFI
jgi:predicted nucleic acid-binding protein